MLIFKKGLLYKINYFPWSILLTLFLMTGLSLVTLYAAAGGHVWPWMGAQSCRCGIGFFLLFCISLINPLFYKKYSYVFYLLALLLLISVGFFGSFGLGAKRWINLSIIKIQPSELMKLALIFALGKYINDHPTLSWRHIFPLGLIAGLPVYIVIRQPDLGTGIIICLVFFSILLSIGLNLRIFILGLVAAVGLYPLVWTRLHDYQKSRLFTFLDPNRDPLGAGYQILQSKISLGSGRFWGRGFLEGIPSHLDFLPEKQTDFIFTTFGETFGFLGSIGLLFTYSLLLWQGHKILWKTRSLFTYIVTAGMNSLLFIHVTINIAMVMGLLPIVGVPLPFLSYGGSSFVTFAIGYGMICSIHIHETIELPYRKIFFSF